MTITHAWGTDAYPVKPHKVVATGTSVDNLLELGITPDVVINTPIDKDVPWREGKLDGVTVLEMPDFRTMPIEKIAAEKPDFIVGDFWRISQDNYAALKDIAPTLGGIGATGLDIGWDKQLEALGTIYDKKDEAQAVLAADKKRFADAAAALPGIKGKTGVVAQYIKEKGLGVVAERTEPGNSFYYDLGMTVPESVLGLPNIKTGRAIVSPEQVQLLAADFMVIYPVSGSEADMHTLSGFDQLPQVAHHTTVYGDAQLVQGVNVPSSRSRAWVLEKIMPQLKALSDAA